VAETLAGEGRWTVAALAERLDELLVDDAREPMSLLGPE
jgi:hypothetical protein